MSQVGRVAIVFACLAVTAAPEPAAGQTRMAPTGFFAEGLFSGNFSDLDDLTFINPIGAGATLSQRSGDRIILENVEEVVLASDYMYLGEASTDRTKGTEGNINANEQLLADLYVWRVMLGLRHRF